MERYREKSSLGKEQTIFGGLGLAALLAWMAYEIWRFIFTKAGLGVIIYILGFLGLFVWRCALRYTYILDGDEIVVVTHGLGLERSFAVKAGEVESFSNKYRKSFFRGTGIKKLIHRYSSLDPRPVRILVFKRNGQLQGLLFKASDDFLGNLQELLPGKMLDFDRDGRKLI